MEIALPSDSVMITLELSTHLAKKLFSSCPVKYQLYTMYAALGIIHFTPMFKFAILPSKDECADSTAFAALNKHLCQRKRR